MIGTPLQTITVSNYRIHRRYLVLKTVFKNRYRIGTYDYSNSKGYCIGITVDNWKEHEFKNSEEIAIIPDSDICKVEESEFNEYLTCNFESVRALAKLIVTTKPKTRQDCSDIIASYLKTDEALENALQIIESTLIPRLPLHLVGGKVDD